MIQKKKKKQVSSITHSSNSNKVDIIVFNMTVMIVSVPLPFIKHGNKFQSYSNSYGRCVYIMFIYWVKTSIGDKHISFVSLLSYCFVTIWHCLQVSQCFFLKMCQWSKLPSTPIEFTRMVIEITRCDILGLSPTFKIYRVLRRLPNKEIIIRAIFSYCFQQHMMA